MCVVYAISEEMSTVFSGFVSKFRENLAHFRERLLQGVVGHGVGQADAVVIAEGHAGRGGDVQPFQQIPGEFQGIVHFPAKALVHVDEEVERAVGMRADREFPRVNDGQGHVAAAAESLTHFPHAVHGTGQGGQGGLLRYGTDIGRALSLQGGALLYNLLMRHEEADAPARHGETLREAAEYAHLLRILREIGARAGHLGRSEHELIVHFIRKDVQPGADHHVHDPFQFRGRVHGARGIAGRVQDKEFRLRGDGLPDFIGRHLEAVLRPRLHINRHAARQLDDGGIAHPVRGGNDDLVPRVHRAHDIVVQSLLAAVADDDVLRPDGQIVLVAVVPADGLPQLPDARHRRIPAEITVYGRFGRFTDMLRRGKIRFTHGEARHHNALLFELQGLGVHGQGKRRLDGFDSVRNLHCCSPLFTSYQFFLATTCKRPCKCNTTSFSLSPAAASPAASSNGTGASAWPLAQTMAASGSTATIQDPCSASPAPAPSSSPRSPPTPTGSSPIPRRPCAAATLPAEDPASGPV